MSRSTHFATALTRILDAELPAQFARRAGLDKGVLSLILSGKRKVSPRILETICNGVIRKQDQAELVAAWMRDTLPKTLCTRLESYIIHAPKTDDLPSLPRKTEETLAYWWNEAAKDPGIGEFLAGLRNLREKN